MTETKKISKARAKKTAVLADLKEKLEKASAVFFTDYSGLTHPQLEALRRSLKKVRAEFTVTKNTLLKIAMNDKNVTMKQPASPARLDSAKQAGGCNNETIKQIGEVLKNSTATLFAFGDPIEAVKALAVFIKNTQLPKIKIGIFEGNLAKEADFLKLATIPSREILLATLAGRLQFPFFGLHYALSWNIKRFVTVLNNIKERKPSN